MKKIFLILSFLLIPTQAWAIYELPNDNNGCPADCRQIPWLAGSDQWNGGTLPTYTQVICSGLTQGDTLTNNGPAIQTCLNQASANTAVYIPPGIYYVDSTISIPSNKVLRGAKASATPYMPAPDATATTFKLGSNGMVAIGINESRGTAVNISSGYTKGSQALVLATLSHGLAVNDWISIYERADTGIPVTKSGDIGNCNWCGENNGDNFIQQYAMVTSVNGDTVGISRPLYYAYQTTLSPRVKKVTFSTRYAGLENIRLNGDYTDHPAFITMTGALFSWVKGVETYNAGSAGKANHVLLEWSHGCEVRDSYFHFNSRENGGDRNYGVSWFFWNSDHKVENNILRHHRHSFSFEGGGAGNAILYNYVDDNYTDDTSYLGSARFNHGAHPYMNLFEGNSISHIVADNYWGSSSHFVLFRNHFWGDQTGAGVPGKPSWGFTPVEIWKNQNYYSLVGNVFGVTGKQQNPDWSSYSVRNTNCSDSAPYLVSFGCNSNNSSYDPKPSTTAIMHGNYDLKTVGVAHWEGGNDHGLKNSLYYSSKPSFFGSINWPVYGYDLNSIIGTLPAINRFLGKSPGQLQPPYLHDPNNGN